MNKEFEDEIWESFLKAAVIENSQNEIRDFPSEQELNNLVIPERYDLKMRWLIKHYRYRKNIAESLRYGKKIASIIILIMGMSFAGLLSFEEVRAACYNVIIHIYEKYVQFDFISNSSDTIENLECTYLPEGYYLSESIEDEYRLLLTYTNDSDDIIELIVSFQNASTYVDNEHYIMSDIQINGVDGKFFESTDVGFQNSLTWHTEQGDFILSSSLEKEIMVKIAENIK